MNQVTGALKYNVIYMHICMCVCVYVCVFVCVYIYIYIGLGCGSLHQYSGVVWARLV